ncbi:hypothetical protein T492DRAFT_858276 [Pavlovales sp. CCMP2436]|nr:hypothetical protein T492DRAFT_858276 [Pavlovales sp. CCMP2436]
MYALMGVSPMEAAARIKKQLIDTIGTIAARGHAQLLLASLSALAPIAAQRGNTTNSNQQIISLNALARAHYRISIGTRGERLLERLLENPTLNSIFERLLAELSIEKHVVLHDFIVEKHLL